MSLLAALAFRADVAHTFGDHGGDGGLGFLGEDDDYSSFVDPGKYDYKVIFPYTSGPLGLKLDDEFRVISIEESLAADLTGMMRLNDKLLSIDGTFVSKVPDGIKGVRQRIKNAEKSTEWSWMLFRPDVFEERTPLDLQDVNVTVAQYQRLGVILSADLVVREIQKASIVDEHGNVLVGDKLIAVNDELVGKKRLSAVLPLLNPEKTVRKLRFRPPAEVRKKRLLVREAKHSVGGGDTGVFSVTFRDEAPLGILMSSDGLFKVEGFGVPEAYAGEGGDEEYVAGLTTPAERAGRIMVGDRVIEIDGKRISYDQDGSNEEGGLEALIKEVNTFLNAPVKSKVLRCRGGVHCGVEMVRNAPDVRKIKFVSGNRKRRHSMHATRDHQVPARNSVVRKTGRNGLTADSNGSARSLSVVTNAIGVVEPAFYAKRGIFMINGGVNGTFDFSTGLFGGPLWCKAHGLYVLADGYNSYGCEGLDSDSLSRNTYVIARRGKCFFSNKAINAQYAGAAGIVIIDNEDNDGKFPGRMPAMDEDHHIVKIPAVMISHKDGQKLLDYVSKSQYSGRHDAIIGEFRSENGEDSSCFENEYFDYSNDYEDAGVSNTEAAAADVTFEGGVLEVLDSDGKAVKEYEFLSSKFGGATPTELVSTLMIADPEDGCKPLKNNPGEAKGKVIVLERGTCSLVEKVQRAADLGAAAVLVSNNKLGLEHMEHWDQKYRPYMANKKYNMTAPSAMITQKAGEELKAYASPKHHVRLYGRNTHVDAWKRIGSLFQVDSWPSDQKARGQLYKEYAEQNLPAKAGGDERYECLVAARKVVETHYASVDMWNRLERERLDENTW